MGLPFPGDIGGPYGFALWVLATKMLTWLVHHQEALRGLGLTGLSLVVFAPVGGIELEGGLLHRASRRSLQRAERQIRE